VAISLVAHTVKALPTTGNTVAIDTTGADLLVAAHAQWAGVGIAALSDSKGNTWTPLTSRASSANYLRLFWCRPTSVGAGHLFTLTGSGTFYGALAVAAFRGATAVPFDVEGGAFTQIGGTSFSPGSITPTQNNDLIITAVSNGSGSGATVDSGFIVTDVLNWGSNANEPVGLAYLLQSNAGPVAPTWSWTGSGQVAAVIAAFKAVATSIVVTPAVADSVYSVGTSSLALAPSQIVQMSLVSAPRSIGAVTRTPAVVSRTMSLVSAPQAIGHAVLTESSTVVRPMALVSAPRTIGGVTWSQVSRALSLVSAPRSIGVAVLASAATPGSRQMTFVGSPSAIYDVVATPYGGGTEPPEPPVEHLHFSGTVVIPGGTDLTFSGTVEVPSGAVP